MKLQCSSCGRPIAGADIDLGRGVGVCRACGEIVPIESAGVATISRTDPTPAAQLYKPADLALLNETTIDVGVRAFHMREGPVPVLRGETELPIRDVRGFSVRASFSQTGNQSRRTPRYVITIYAAGELAVPTSLSFSDGRHATHAVARLEALVDEARVRASAMGTVPYRG